MSDIPGVPSAVGIEGIERVPQPSGGVTVRVTGRWRRRRPEWRGPALLVVEVGEQRHRVPAMPEPPSLTGTLPGTWGMTFSVPAELADHMNPGHTWLQLGLVMIPLALPPGPADMPRTPADGPRAPVEPGLLAARELRTLEVAAAGARRRAEEAEAATAELQRELERLRAELAAAGEEPARLKAELEARERDVRRARQAAHAEAAEREQAEARLAEQQRELDRLRRRAREAEERTRELEHELRAAHRAVAEAEQALAVARAAVVASQAAESRAAASPAPSDRGSAEPPPASRAPSDRGSAEPLPASPAPSDRGSAEPPAAPPAPAATGPAQQPDSSAAPSPPPAPPGPAARAIPGSPDDHELLSAALRPPSRWARRALPAVPAPLLDAEAELVRARAREGELERGARRAVEARVVALEEDLERQRERSARALRAVSDVREELRRLRADPGALRPDPDVEPERLSAALERLRERHPTPDPAAPEPEPDTASAAAAGVPADDTAPEPVTTAAGVPADDTAPEPAEVPALPPAAGSDLIPRLFRRLVRDDAAAAGRLLVGLLPAQRLVHPRPLAYDLVLGPGACLCVTVGAGEPQIEMRRHPRGAAEVQFSVRGDEAALARLVAAGALRRWLGRGLARLSGERRAFEALRRLVLSPPPLVQLAASGAELDPPVVLALAAALIDATAHAPREFVLVHRPAPGAPPSAALQVPETGPPTVTALALTLTLPATVTIICPPGRLLAALLGVDRSLAAVTGDQRPLDWLRGRLERA
ncbi:MAG TPA: hypothetical protein VE995_01680 [Gaiellaceae bacterium]|nr:hypothetical protein [Gaiellaceae bacterium]